MLLIVSDLDGTLLDAATYSMAPAMPAVERLRRSGVPLVLCSSKTRAEIEVVMARLGIDQPFICENGGAVYLPSGFMNGAEAHERASTVGNRVRIELGRPYREIVAILRQVARARQVRVVGFADMSIAEIGQDCGLPPLDAQLAKLREYDEPFRLPDADPAETGRFLRALHQRGLRTEEGGRYFHATGGSDKGAAVHVLRTLYGRRGERVVAVGLGDAMNDVSLLEAVDVPIIVRSVTDGMTARLQRAVPAASVTDEPGPAGWATAVGAVLDEWEAGLRHSRSRLSRR